MIIRLTSFWILLFIQAVVYVALADAVPVQKAEDNLKFRHFTLDQGLNQSTVLCILQDSQGFMWFGTRDGLNKFDGRNFTVYHYNTNDSTSISNNWIKVLYEDQEGNIWVGTENGLNQYRRETNDFQRYLHNQTWQVAGSQHAIRDIVQHTNGKLYIGTENGIGEFDKTSRQLIPLAALEDKMKTTADKRIRNIHIDSKGRVWVVSMGGIWQSTADLEKFTAVDFPADLPPDVNTGTIFYLHEDKSGNIWLGYEQGLAILDAGQQQFVPYHFKGKPVIESSVRQIVEDHRGIMWVGTYAGLYRVDMIRRDVTRYVHEKNKPHSLSQNSVHSMCMDAAGNLWVGTWAGGINYLDKRFGAFTQYTAGQNEAMLSYGVVSSFVEDQEGNFWVGTEGGGLNYFDRKTEKFTHLKNDPNIPNSLSVDNVKALMMDSSGVLWIGTHAGGLNKLEIKNGRKVFTHFRHDPANPNSLSADWVISLFEGSDGYIWVGTSGGGINWLNTHNGRFEISESAMAAVGQKVYTIREGRQKQVYVGSDNGLAMFDKYSRQLHAFGDKPILLKGRTVLSVWEDETYLWIGTEGDGLYAYNYHSGEMQRFGKDDGLPNEVVYGILEDRQGNLWLSTNKGLCSFDKESHATKNYDVYDGLQSNEYNYGAYTYSSRGELVFGGARGFNIFYPEKVKDNPFVPPVVITAFRLKNKPEHLHQYMQYKPDGKGYLELTHEQNIVSFDFVALNYSQPEKNQYAYKLDGFDEEWNRIGNKNTATYTNLNHGTYTFKVKASNNDQVWNEEGVAIDLVILPPFWQTWWAYTLYIIISIVSLLLARKYTLMRIQDKNALKIERMEKENVERVNQMKIQFFTNISHEFRTPLTLIIDPLERLIKNERFSPAVAEKLTIMQRNAGVLLRLINQLLDFRKHEFGKLELRAAKDNVGRYVEEVCHSFDEQAAQKRIDFSVEVIEKGIYVWFDRDKLEEILYNLLSNAFKHTPEKGTIKVSVKRTPDHEGVEIAVEDNGRGMSEESTKYIFDRFYQLEHSGGDKNAGTGIGLALTKNLVELHQGEISVSSTLGKGTRFCVRLPLGNAHLAMEQMIKGVDTLVNGADGEQELKLPRISEEEDQQLEDIEKNTNPSLLIVEDNHDVRKYIRSIFENKYDIYEAEDGQQGQELAMRIVPDLIISDVMMPRKNGIELCKALKSTMTTSHIPIVLLTAKASEAHQQEGLETGADDYIAKPFNSELLELKIDNIVRSRRQLQEKLRQSLILEPSQIAISSPDEMFLKKAIEIVEANMADSDFNVNVFIREMGMSRSVVYRKLKALTDQSTIDFIKVAKLKRAAQMLQDASLTVTEVAYGTGFTDVKYFRNCFREQFGVPPTVYRKTHE